MDLKDSVFQSLAITLFDAQIVTLWSVETRSSWVLCSYNKTSLIFKSFLAFWHKMSPIDLYLPCSTPGISHFSKEPWLLLAENNI